MNQEESIKPDEFKKMVDNTVKSTVAKEEKQKSLTPGEKEFLEKKRKYVQAVRAGGAFIRYIMDDIKLKKDKQQDRALRRRIEQKIKKGVITREIVQIYQAQMDQILKEIDRVLKEDKDNKKDESK